MDEGLDRRFNDPERTTGKARYEDDPLINHDPSTETVEEAEKMFRAIGSLPALFKEFAEQDAELEQQEDLRRRIYDEPTKSSTN